MTGSNCPSKRGVSFIESLVTVKLLKNDRNWTNTRCPSRLKEVSVKRELAVKVNSTPVLRVGGGMAPNGYRVGLRLGQTVWVHELD